MDSWPLDLPPVSAWDSSFPEPRTVSVCVPPSSHAMLVCSFLSFSHTVLSNFMESHRAFLPRGHLVRSFHTYHIPRSISPAPNCTRSHRYFRRWFFVPSPISINFLGAVCNIALSLFFSLSSHCSGCSALLCSKQQLHTTYDVRAHASEVLQCNSGWGSMAFPPK